MALAYDQLKTELSLCTGTRKGGQRCNGALRVCGQCGARGCKQNQGSCTGQAFDVLDKCLKCGAHTMQPAG